MRLESERVTPGDLLAHAHAQGCLEHSIAGALRVIAAARAEREMVPVHRARQHLAAVYGANRLRRRLEADLRGN